jgi:hypothetical protein
MHHPQGRLGWPAFEATLSQLAGSTVSARAHVEVYWQYVQSTATELSRPLPVLVYLSSIMHMHMAAQSAVQTAMLTTGREQLIKRQQLSQMHSIWNLAAYAALGSSLGRA